MIAGRELLLHRRRMKAGGRRLQSGLYNLEGTGHDRAGRASHSAQNKKERSVESETVGYDLVTRTVTPRLCAIINLLAEMRSVRFFFLSGQFDGNF